jgi:hypothetical protein
MKKVIVSLSLALVMTAAFAMPVLAAPVEQTETASVTVNTYISATVTDYGSDGIDFGSLNPGALNQAEADQTAGTGAVQVSIAAETNVACKIGVKGSGDFSDGGTNSFGLNNATWDSDNDAAGATAMSTTYAQIGSDTTPGSATTQEIWHWISVPNGQAAANYDTTFYYKADQSL